MCHSLCKNRMESSTKIPVTELGTVKESCRFTISFVTHVTPFLHFTCDLLAGHTVLRKCCEEIRLTVVFEIPAKS
jgi:hypothetical protein